MEAPKSKPYNLIFPPYLLSGNNLNDDLIVKHLCI